MRYASDKHDLVIDAQGGYAALEHLGFRSETTIVNTLKTVENSNRIKKWVADNCCPECKKTHAFCACENEGDDMVGTKKKAAKTMAKINAGVSKAMGAVSKKIERPFTGSLVP